MGPVRIRPSSHDFATQSSHSMDRAGWQAKKASIEFWIPWRNAHKPHALAISASTQQFLGTTGKDTSIYSLGHWNQWSAATDHTSWTSIRWRQTINLIVPNHVYSHPNSETGSLKSPTTLHEHASGDASQSISLSQNCMCTHTQAMWSSDITDHTSWAYTRWNQTVGLFHCQELHTQGSLWRHDACRCTSSKACAYNMVAKSDIQQAWQELHAMVPHKTTHCDKADKRIDLPPCVRRLHRDHGTCHVAFLPSGPACTSCRILCKSAVQPRAARHSVRAETNPKDETQKLSLCRVGEKIIWWERERGGGERGTEREREREEREGGRESERERVRERGRESVCVCEREREKMSNPKSTGWDFCTYKDRLLRIQDTNLFLGWTLRWTCPWFAAQTVEVPVFNLLQQRHEPSVVSWAKQSEHKVIISSPLL